MKIYIPISMSIKSEINVERSVGYFIQGVSSICKTEILSWMCLHIVTSSSWFA